MYGVFDGHGGWQLSEYASTNLLKVIGEQLQKQPNVATALTATYNCIEESYISKVIESYKLGFGEVGKVGSCAIVAVIKDKQLTVANSGDCRAVVGSVILPQSNQPPASVSVKETPRSQALVNVNGVLYNAYQINRDHNARTPLEQYLLHEAHPNEENIVVCKNSHACYVKGRLQLTRALGDAYLKYPEFNAPANAHRSR